MVSAKQMHIPIADQRGARNIAIKKLRLLNCWLGVATKEQIGTTFCVECEYLQECKSLYRFFNTGADIMHPASLSRIILTKFMIDSEYL